MGTVNRVLHNFFFVFVYVIFPVAKAPLAGEQRLQQQAP